MAMIFDRPGFATGLMVLKYQDAGGNPVRFVLRPTDKGQSIDFPSEAQAVTKYGNGRWLLTPAEANTRRAEQANNRANNDPRKF